MVVCGPPIPSYSVEDRAPLWTSEENKHASNGIFIPRKAVVTTDTKVREIKPNITLPNSSRIPLFTLEHISITHPTMRALAQTYYTKA